MTLPTFLGVGVPRAGTTWLHSLLESHPDVYVPARRKEIRFFDRHYEQGIQWYQALFPDDAEAGRYAAIGEISPQYLYDERSPERIAATIPDVKLVLNLRHPVDRAYSNYGFTVQRANYRGSFADFVEARPSTLEWGFYTRYLKRYLEHFERERILPLLFENLFADLDATRSTIADFVGVDAARFLAGAGEGRVNRSTVPSHGSLSRVAVRAGRKLRRSGLEPAVDLARRLGVQRAIVRGAALPKIDPGLRAELSRRYVDEFDELEAMLGIDLASWRA